jgi:phage tail-like protein
VFFQEQYPLNVFRFRVDFYVSSDQSKSQGERMPICGGSFSECTGIEANMQPKSINEGGRNYGQVHRVGRTTFGTVILKRGVTTTPHMWQWFELVTQGAYAYRLDAEVSLLDVGAPSPQAPGLMVWTMHNALPTKFKAADFNAKASEVGIEELHFVHEGLGHIR